MPWLKRFRRDESGSFTIEFVLWVPLILGLLVIVVDATTLYITHSEMWNVARDTARRISWGKITNEDAAVSYAVDAMSLRDHPYCVDVRYDKAGSGSVEVIIALAVGDMSIIGYGSPLRLLTDGLMARVEMRPDSRYEWTESGSGFGCAGAGA